MLTFIVEFIVEFEFIVLEFIEFEFIEFEFIVFDIALVCIVVLVFDVEAVGGVIPSG